MTRAELLRRAVHVLIGLGAFLVPVIGVRAALILAIVAIPANAWLLPHLPVLKSVLRPDKRGAHAVWAYPLTCAVLLAFFYDEPGFAQAGWLALGIGDGLAPFIAQAVRGGSAWPWCPQKRIAVSFLAGVAAGCVVLPVVSVPAAVAVAVAGSVADGLPVEDNFTWGFLPALAAWAVGG